MQKRVTLFVAPNCSWCLTAKKYLRDKKIRFKTVDVSKDRNARKSCEKNGCRGVPTVLIANRWICGFDKVKINRELGIKG